MKDAQKILRQKALAFFMVALSALGTVFKEQWGIDGGPLLDGVLIACFVLGLFVWMGSKRMERRSLRDEEEERK